MRKENSTNAINETYLKELCAVQESLNLISSRWTLAVLYAIDKGNNRFSSLQKELENISKKVLSDRVNLLCESGIIQKKIITEKPLNIEYQITKKGQELIKVLAPIKLWATKNR